MLQDLLPLLAAVQPWLTANSDVTICSNANPQLAWWLAGLGISNPLALYEFGALCSASPLLATFEVFLLQIDNWTMKYQPIALFRLLNRLLRETLSQSLKRDHQQRRAPLCIWSSRADTGARHIQNEGAAIEIMHSVCTESGLAVAVFGTEPRSHQPSALTVIAAFADATFIAGPHGGRLLHVVCAPKVRLALLWGLFLVFWFVPCFWAGRSTLKGVNFRPIRPHTHARTHARTHPRTHARSANKINSVSNPT
jgi:hypothetical protein